MKTATVFRISNCYAIVVTLGKKTSLALVCDHLQEIADHIWAADYDEVVWRVKHNLHPHASKQATKTP